MDARCVTSARVERRPAAPQARMTVIHFPDRLTGTLTRRR
jgi:hypothetical protein